MKDACLKINGGICGGCGSEELLNYYNCGTDRNLTVAGIAGNMTDTAGDLTTPVVGVTTPATPATPTTPMTPANPALPAVGGVTVDIQSYIPGAHPNTAGGPPCPWDKPESGSACDTLGYEWA